MIAEAVSPNKREETLLFEKIIPISAPISNFTVPNLNGDMDKRYRIEFDLTVTQTAQRTFIMTINGSGASQLSWGRYSGYANGGETEGRHNTQSYIRPLGVLYGSARQEGIMNINAKSGKVRMMDSVVNSREPGQGHMTQIFGAAWDDVNTNITSLTFTIDGNNFYGTVRVYRVNK